MEQKKEKIVEEADLDTILEYLGEETPINALPEVDAIFGFMYYRQQIAEHIVKVYKRKEAEKIILTGKGGGDFIPKNFKTEAEHFASILMNAGIPEQSLILEKESLNILENVRFGIKASHAIGFFPKSLVVCSMPPLLRRVRATFQKQFPEIIVYGSAFKMHTGWFTYRRIKGLLRELDKLEEYAKKGHMAAVVIPEKVLLAKEKIRKELMP